MAVTSQYAWSISRARCSYSSPLKNVVGIMFADGVMCPMLLTVPLLYLSADGRTSASANRPACGDRGERLYLLIVHTPPIFFRDHNPAGCHGVGQKRCKWSILRRCAAGRDSDDDPSSLRPAGIPSRCSRPRSNFHEN